MPSSTALVIVLAAVGCGSAVRVDLRTEMERRAAPDEGLLQTQFAHIGAVDCPDGRFQVATQSLVCTGMLAPRGQRRLLLFDERGDIVATHSLTAASPLWCEGSRIYLFGCGSFGGVPCDPRLQSLFNNDEMPVGNVLDFSAGVHSPVLTAERRYGSSGGLMDDSWAPHAEEIRAR